MKLCIPLLLCLGLPCEAGVVTILADRDQTLIESSTGCCSNGAGPYFFAGDRNGGGINRGLMHFDIAAAIPAGAAILEVRLDLNLSRSRAGTEVMALHRVQQDWGEGTSANGPPGPGATIGVGAPTTAGDATWIHAVAPNTFWANPGGDFDGSPSATSMMDGASGLGIQSFSSPTMVADVQAWLLDGASNFGWLLRAEDETSRRSARRFDSRESGDPSVTPRIEVVYSEALGSNYCVTSPNSAGTGATIAADGCSLASQQALTLRAAQLPARVPGLFFFSPSQVQTPLGDGFLCVGGATVSIYPPAFADGAGIVQRIVDFGTPAATTIVSGAALNFQFWYRDRAAAGAGHNLSDGLSVVFQ